MATGLLEALGLPKSGAPTKGAGATPPPGAQGMPPPPDAGFSPLAPQTKPYLNPNSPEMRAILMKGIEEQAAKDRKDAEAALVKMNKALADAKAFVAALPDEQLRKSSYAQVMADVRKRYPEAAVLSQWVKETSLNVPEMKAAAVSQVADSSSIDGEVARRRARLCRCRRAGMVTVNTDRLTRCLLSELPAGVTVNSSGGVVQLSLEGAALAVATPAATSMQGGQGGTPSR